MRRLRVLHVIVQPVLVWDDGDTLTPGPSAQPLPLAVADLIDFPAELQAQVENLQDATPEPPDR